MINLDRQGKKNLNLREKICDVLGHQEEEDGYLTYRVDYDGMFRGIGRTCRRCDEFIDISLEGWQQWSNQDKMIYQFVGNDTAATTTTGGLQTMSIGTGFRTTTWQSTGMPSSAD